MIYKYFLGIGSNIEPRLEYINTALEELDHIGSIKKKSSIYESFPWGKKNQSDFLNATIRFHSSLNPFHLLSAIKNIEKRIGRIKRNQRWVKREIDIDILFADKISIQKNRLNIPHKYFKERNFVLAPMSEIAGDYKPENHDKNITYYMQHSEDKSNVKLSTFNW